MTPNDRHRAVEAYLEDVERHPAAGEAALRFVAAESKARVQTVGRWSLSKRASFLARARGLPAPYLHNFLVSLHRRRRGPMLACFLDVAGIAHRAGFVDGNKDVEPASLERLVAAVQAISTRFPPDEVALYLDALELQGERPWAALSKARRLARPPDESS